MDKRKVQNELKVKAENSFFKVAVKHVRHLRMYPKNKEEKMKWTQDEPLQRYLCSDTSRIQEILMKLIKIKENAEMHKSKIKKIKNFEKYKLIVRNVLKKSNIDTDLQLDLESLINLREPDDSYSFKIEGKAIVENISEKAKEMQPKPILFQTKHEKDPAAFQEVETTVSEQSAERGVIRYKLSDRSFIEKGWTKLPIEKVVRKKNVYRVVPAHPEFDWFTRNKNKGPMRYDTGEKLAEFDDNGRGRWYYKNGRLALNYYDCEEGNAQQRYLVYSSGEPDERGRSRPVTILAMFDILGNGLVFDHSGKIRIKYNQSEGVVLDRGIGPVSHWKWHSLNDPPILQRVMMDTYTEEKDPDIMKLESDDDRKPRQDFSDMLEIEFSNCIKDQTKKLSQKFKPYQIKMKALKINEQFSLRILDQANVHLTFKDGSANFKLNLGMVVDNQQILHTETEDVGDVFTSLDKVRDQTDSILDLKRDLDNLRRIDQARINRELKLRPRVFQPSVENLTAAASKPLRRTVRTAVPQSSISCERICQRRSPQPNLYYNNRLI